MAGGLREQTPQVTTGNVATVNDLYSTSLPNNGAQNPPGAYYEFGSNSAGNPVVVRYVRFNPTASGTPIVGPVYWKDEAHTTVTPTMSEAISTKANSIAGALLNPSVTPGNWCFIQVYGLLAAVVVAASTAIDDILIGATGYEITARIAAGSAITNKPFAIALTAISGGVSDIFVDVETF